MKINLSFLFYFLFFSFLLVFIHKNLQSIFSCNFLAVNLHKELVVDKQTLTERFIQETNCPGPSLWIGNEAIDNGDLVKAGELIEPNMNKQPILGNYYWGKILSETGQMESAVNVWKKIGLGSYQIILNEANEFRDKGKYKDALIAYEAAYEIDPETGTISLVNFLANQLSEFEKAKELLLLASETFVSSPFQKNWLYSLGIIYKYQLKYEEAVMIFEKYTKKYPSDQNGFLELGIAYFQRGDGFDKTYEIYQRAIALDPSNGDIYYNLAQVLVLEERYQEAENWFKKAIECNPDIEGWWISRANVARVNGNLDLAYEIYYEALNLFPTWSPLYYEISLLYSMKNNNEEAITNIEKALNLEETPSLSYLIRAGKIYESAEIPEKALIYYHKALILEPNNLNLIKIIENLKK